MTDTALTELEVIEMINRFNSDDTFSELREMYSSKSFPEILSISRKEMSHSAFIAWLLKPGESHGLGTFPITQFFKILVRRDIEQKWGRHSNPLCINKCSQCQSKICSTESIWIDCINEKLHFDNLEISAELPSRGSKEGRLDIRISGIINGKTVCVIVENKVDSKEHDTQTKTYYQNESANSKAEIMLFVYLTPNNDNINWPVCECRHFIQISYQDIMDEILDPLMHKDIPQRTRFIVHEYIRCLSVPALDMESENGTVKIKPEMIMATSENTSKLLREFWYKNENLFKAILTELESDPEMEEECRNDIKKMRESISSNAKYQFGNNPPTRRISFAREVLVYLLNKGIGENTINEALKNGDRPNLLLSVDVPHNSSYADLKAHNLCFWSQWRSDEDIQKTFIEPSRKLAEKENIDFPEYKIIKNH